MLEHLPHDLLVSVLEHANPGAHIVSASSLLSHAQSRAVILAWSHTCLTVDDWVMQEYFDCDSPSDMDKMYSDTRGLATPVTWYFKNIIKNHRRAQVAGSFEFYDEEADEDDDEGNDDIKGRHHVFQQTIPLDHLLSPRRWQRYMDHNRPLAELVADWDALVPEDDQQFESLPRLRCIPEALQLPAFFLITGELSHFESALAGLGPLIPTLATSRAPLRTWMRFGLDDRELIRRVVSQHHGDQDGLDDAVKPITLPMYWALTAAIEGHVQALDYLVSARLLLDVPEWVSWIKTRHITSIVLPSLATRSFEGAVQPTWTWLKAHGYLLPRQYFETTTSLTRTAWEYDTFRWFFIHEDLPELDRLDAEGFAARGYNSSGFDVTDWVVKGHHDLLPVMIEKRLVEPRHMLHYVMIDDWEVGEVKMHQNTLMEIANQHLDGGALAVVATGLDSPTEGVVNLALRLLARIHGDDNAAYTMVVADHVNSSELLPIVLSNEDYLARLDLVELLEPLLQAISTGTGLSADTQDVLRLISAIQARPDDSWARVLEILDTDYMLSDRIELFLALSQRNETATARTNGDGPATRTDIQHALYSILPPPPSEMYDPLLTLESDNEVLQQTIARVVARGSATRLQPFSKGGREYTATHPLAGAPTVAGAVACVAYQKRTLVPAWIVAVLAQHIPGTVVLCATMSRRSPLWLWQLRVDALADGARNLSDVDLAEWEAMVADAVENQNHSGLQLLVNALSGPQWERDAELISQLGVRLGTAFQRSWSMHG
ncbi:hypothetical protein BC828DRAFT_180696 [Blastocladiella britannica]|nr:hypothetical protein BC828DRAFT_180696 [Blastocladiella britannica]